MEIYRLFHFQLLLFINPYSLEPPFRKILNNALKHEENGYKCPILSNACPFNNKKFIEKIELGNQKPKEFMDEILETVISDLNKPFNIKGIVYYNSATIGTQPSCHNWFHMR